MPTTRVLATIVVSLLAVTACGSDDTTSSDATTTPDTPMTTDGVDAVDTPAAQASVGLEGTRFDPTDIQISAGDTVTFTNNDPFNHTVTSGPDSSIEFDSGEMSQDATFEQSFDTAGTYAFFCQIHPSMQGTITVS